MNSRELKALRERLAARQPQAYPAESPHWLDIAGGIALALCVLVVLFI